MKQNIPTYDLPDVSQHQFIIERMMHPENAEEALLDKGIHRDSHYIFTIMESGYVKMMVDFAIVEAQGSGIFCVLPGQVHQGLEMKDVAGWFLAVKADFVPDIIRSVFEESLIEIEPLFLDNKEIEKMGITAGLLYDFYRDEGSVSKEGILVIRSLLNAFMGMFAHRYSQEKGFEISDKNRSAQLTRAFRILVRKNYKTTKSPSAYADLLHISRGYLTEVIREVTGKSAQHWIHQEILIEAKRLLVFTDLTVKGIAYELGYSDHAYFSRLFAKLVDESPSEFRDKHRGAV
ncbi:AraC family transcriptional regulator [Chryseobacterium sp. JUb7]|uniref:helix-turn-helix domain-containing protein n=1 Tax=Chryseobacterium sp. JUb7 TaxID=2940599 RepID=UPI002168FFEB|nr:AraC family transcriptional regulator [Chryseobacterium sp. JUb7]MCS3528662.1 AraC-like DNA-binding protein [Chryseobacterium sp. JUb7]